ncbi:MAG: N-(5'-phosphoribosyl)anthranilate isomerase, partial [Candidatus Aenigmarchaeota archaeon]|nr:N-(5'-phosphoribosyl)anthranilate isomerase [Candidatus Aenigmarchaeota archaeon]
MTKIKICGITNALDAIKCVELGADALGFIFAKSRRQVTKEKAREIIEKLPPFISKVGVFVDEKEDVVREIQSYCGLTALQFH